MATDARQIAETLAGFHGFRDRTVIDVGAGGGQLVEYARGARRVHAVDHDVEALARLAGSLRGTGLEDVFLLVERDFLEVSTPADVVLLEFCLHLMPDPGAVLAHARS